MKTITQEQKKKIKELHNDGHSFKEIAEKINVSAKTASKIVKEFTTTEKTITPKLIEENQEVKNIITRSINTDINNIKVKFEMCCDTLRSVINEGVLDTVWVDEKLDDYELMTYLTVDESVDLEYERGIKNFKQEHGLQVFSEQQLKLVLPQVVKLWNWMINQRIKPENIPTHFKLFFERHVTLGELNLEKQELENKKEHLRKEVNEWEETLRFKEDLVAREIYKLDTDFEKYQKNLSFKYQKLQHLQQVIVEDEAKMKEIANMQQEIEAMRRTISELYN